MSELSKSADCITQSPKNLAGKKDHPTIPEPRRKLVVKIGDYNLGDKIGKGAFGQVYKGFNVKTGDFVAIKQIEKSRIDNNTLQSVKKEFDILLNLKHNNIVKVLGVVETSSKINFILEYVENGSLRDIIDKFGPLSEDLAISYLYQLLQGLVYLHANRVIHRDIKSSNILITKDGTIKLADFGVASQLSDQAQMTYSVVGTPYWMSPESIQMSGQTSASDIWSLACTMIELVSGSPPYFSLQPMAAMFRIVQDPHPPYPANLSEEFQSFLNTTFEKDPLKRPSAAQLLLHPIFKKHQQNNITIPTLSELTSTLKTLNTKQHHTRSRASLFSINWGDISSSNESTSSGVAATASAMNISAVPSKTTNGVPTSAISKIYSKINAK
ncbi:hypothetical protein CYY_004703 [Polysphondylium violaceum]|uniref:non-specific serine/threonine protein kinase n=1 Tax=Polysphondylium violaceum TaxID=133409 RepID=A0A8J4UST4_9MYCE|nr:hypothetical protein CYY_004703 [Polysphondylium violaceum]